MEYKKTVERQGGKLDINWNVIPSKKFGLPGPFDKEIFRQIEQMVGEADYPVSNPVKFTTYELCKRLDLGVGGRQYDTVHRSLKRIATTSINSKGTFYDKDKKKWIDEIFHIYDKVFFKGETLPDGGVAETNRLYLSDPYRKSLNAKYVKPLNYSYWRKLSKPLSKRLYELLGVKFYGALNNDQPFVRYRYESLCQLLPMKQRDYVSQAKQRLKPGHKELTETGFLDRVEWDERLVYYFPGSRAKEEVEEYADKKKEQPEHSADFTDKVEVNGTSRELQELKGRQEEWENAPLEEKVERSLEHWLVGRKAFGKAPTESQIEAKRGELKEFYQAEAEQG